MGGHVADEYRPGIGMLGSVYSGQNLVLVYFGTVVSISSSMSGVLANTMSGILGIGKHMLSLELV